MDEKGTRKKALITGINGQDGSFLTELLLAKDYEVWGILRRNSIAENQTYRLNNARLFGNDRIHLIYGDVTDAPSIYRAIAQIKPDEIYNLAAQSHVKISFNQPAYTTKTIVEGAINIFEAVKTLGLEKSVRIYQASSSEMFGNSVDYDGYQRESTPMKPVSPYGAAKLYAHNLASVYRDSYDMYISCGILFNHESERRGTNFVTSKVVKEACRIKAGKSEKLLLGNLNATRDWGHAKDYVEAMWRILQLPEPIDLVFATGRSRSVRDLCEYVFNRLGMDYKDYVGTDPAYYRPKELNNLKGDVSRASELLGWRPQVSFEDMLNIMIEAEIKKHGEL